MKKHSLMVFLIIGLLAPLPVLGQSAAAPNAPQEDPAHGELRALRDGLLEAINKGDIEGQLSFLHPNVVVTWQNGEVSRGREGVRDYLNRMLKGPDPVVRSYQTALNVDELTILYGGDTGISFGSSEDHFKLKGGLDFNLKGRWSAALVKENGRWLIASLHTSTNVFDNPLLALAKNRIYRMGALFFVIGIAAGLFIGRIRRPAV